tara:strand:- start:2526 stop:2885 length:360 start_codon:yes stop_codon:yes gene_type:complete
MTGESYNEVDGFGITETIRTIVFTLRKALDDLPDLGKDMCDAENRYEIAKAKKVFEFKEKGISVTLIKEVCNGSEGVHGELYRKNLAKVLYDSQKAKIKGLEQELSAMQTLYKTEIKGY